MFKKKKSVPAFSRAHTLRLYPTADQAHILNRFAGITRACHNIFLEREQKEYRETGKYPGQSWLVRQCAALKRKKELEWLKLAPAQALQRAAIELHLTFEAFFKYCSGQSKVKRGFPKFHKRGKNESFRIPQGNFVRVNGKNPAGFAIKQESNQIYIPKIGWLDYRNGAKDIS